MTKPIPRKLTKQQLAILVHIYEFRFVTTKHIQLKLTNTQLQQTQRRLNILVRDEYVGRNYTSRDRLNGRYASYYLTNLGIKTLKQQTGEANTLYLNDSVLHALYKDKNASERFIAHCVAVGDVWHALRTKYGTELCNYFPKSNITGDESFLQESKPDGYIELKTKFGKGSRTKRYILYVCEEAVPMFVHKKLIKNLLEYADEGYWEAENGTPLPTMLLACDTERLRAKLEKLSTKMFGDTYMRDDEITFVVRTIAAVADRI
jgi:Replication-relaxation